MPMLYLVRHGEARGDGPDAERALTESGVAGVERVAAWAARAHVAVDEIRHSGKRRAMQTAEILAARLQPRAGITRIDGIAPNDDPIAFARAIAREEDVLVVSHLPFLAYAAAALTGTAVPSIAFQPGTLVALARIDDRFIVEAVVHPGVV